MLTRLFTEDDVGLLDGLFDQLPLWAKIHIIFCWADVFDPENDYVNQGIIDLIGTITKLNFHHYLMIDKKKFLSLGNLPFTSNLRRLDLSHSTIGRSSVLIEFLSHPIFHHLVHLNLSSTEITSLRPLLNSPHTFTTLHTLNLSNNYPLAISLDQISHKFPNLQDLNLFATYRFQRNPPQQFPPPPPPTFQLKKLSIPLHFNYFKANNSTSNNTFPNSHTFASISGTETQPSSQNFSIQNNAWWEI